MAAIQQLDTAATPGLHLKPCHPNASPVQQTGPLFHPLAQHVHQGASCAVLHMQHPPMAGGCFQGRSQAMVVSIKVHAQPLQAIHATGRGIHQKPHGIAITQSGTGFQGVVGMAAGGILRSGHGGNAPLSPTAGGAAPGVSVQQQHR